MVVKTSFFAPKKGWGYVTAAIPFYQLPKPLFADDKYRDLSIEAKLLYTFMRDRYRLSVQNNWRDTMGVYIKMTRKAICDLLKRSEPTVRKIIAELKQIGLIIEKRVGLTQCNKIYVQFLEGEGENALRSTTKTSEDSAKKADVALDRKVFSRNKNNSKQIHYRKMTSRPDLPQNGDIWEENGEKYAYHHGFTQRYYEPDELDSLTFDLYAVNAAIAK